MIEGDFTNDGTGEDDEIADRPDRRKGAKGRRRKK